MEGNKGTSAGGTGTEGSKEGNSSTGAKQERVVMEHLTSADVL